MAAAAARPGEEARPAAPPRHNRRGRAPEAFFFVKMSKMEKSDYN